MKHEIRIRKNRGFSLVEMLVVIAVIGIIAGIAVPSIGSVSDKANTAKVKRNAQTIASLYNASRGVGATYSSGSVSGMIDELIDGKLAVDLAGTEFKISPLSDENKVGVLKYVSYDAAADMMIYDPSGGQEAADSVDEHPGDGWINRGSHLTEADAQSNIDFMVQHNMFVGFVPDSWPLVHMYAGSVDWTIVAGSYSAPEPDPEFGEPDLDFGMVDGQQVWIVYMRP